MNGPGALGEREVTRKRILSRAMGDQGHAADRLVIHPSPHVDLDSGEVLVAVLGSDLGLVPQSSGMDAG